MRCGELSRASIVLTSAGLAPSTADTAKNLVSKHPPRVKSIDLLNTPHSAAINLSEMTSMIQYVDLVVGLVLDLLDGVLNTLKY